jgi:hypothetical protein
VPGNGVGKLYSRPALFPTVVTLTGKAPARAINPEGLYLIAHRGMATWRSHRACNQAQAIRFIERPRHRSTLLAVGKLYIPGIQNLSEILA